jgi:hypothetical protein
MHRLSGNVAARDAQAVLQDREPATDVMIAVARFQNVNVRAD